MLSDKQLKIMAFPYSDRDAIICDGAIRSGKTSVMTVSFVRWAMESFDRQKFIILGNSVGAVSRNVVEPYISLSYAKRRFKMDYNRSRNVLTVSNGERSNQFFIFGANNARSYEPIQGMTAAGCFVDEAAICDKKAVDTATARCSVHGSKLWFNCNPSFPSHWFREEWILDPSKNALYLHFTMDDNPGLTDEIKARYSSLYKGVFYERYIKGLWIVAEGLVYQFDSPKDYTASDDDARGIYYTDKGERKERVGRWFVSIDYGITNPFAALLWRLEDGRAYLVDEYYFNSRKLGCRRTDSEHYAALEELAGDRNIEAIIIDPSANSFKEEIWRAGRFGVYDADNSVVEGIRVTDDLLHRGAVKIGENCSETILEMQQYRWDDSGRDKPVKENDHAMDAMRYFCNTVLKYETF